MNIKRFLKFLIVNPNSSEGLRIRADLIRESGDKETNPRNQESQYLYAELLIKIAEKNWPVWKNKLWIKENIRDKLPPGLL